MKIVCREVEKLIFEINRLWNEIRKTGGASMVVGSNSNRCVVRNDHISLVVDWHQSYSNSLDGSALTIAEFNAQIPLPDTRKMSFSEPTMLCASKFLPELSLAREYGWIEQNSKTFEFFFPPSR